MKKDPFLWVFLSSKSVQNLCSFNVGRVTSEHKERFKVKTHKDEFEAEMVGNLRFSAKDRSDFPAVGDWVVYG